MLASMSPADAMTIPNPLPAFISSPEAAARHTLCVISATRARAVTIGRLIPELFCVQALGLDDLSNAQPSAFVLIDMKSTAGRDLFELRTWLQSRPMPGFVIFIIDKGTRLQLVQAWSIGASDILFRPISEESLCKKILDNLNLILGSQSLSKADKSFGMAASLVALQSIFSAARVGRPINTRMMMEAAGALVSQIETYGLADWVAMVRAHHDQTFQHCLLVAGTAAAFAVELEFNAADRNRVATAGLLHDIGKAKIPVEILDKPGKLDSEEMEIVRRHPQFGHESLQFVDDLPSEMLDIVLSHHEYLDGSGYPRGLDAKTLSDLTRIVTIADIFSALIEYRPYKKSLSGPAAYQALIDFGPKLDRDLVRAFKPLSAVRLDG